MPNADIEITPPVNRPRRARGPERKTPKLDQRSLPLTTRQLLDRLDLRCAEEGLSNDVRLGFRSVITSAIRHAFRMPNGDVPSAKDVEHLEVQDKLDAMHILARESAIARGHQSPGDQATRAARAVALVSGARYDTTRSTRMMPVPAAWTPLVDALKAGKGEIRFLAHCATLCGYAALAPTRLPSYAELLAAAARYYDGDIDLATRRFRTTASVYRKARRLLPEDTRSAFASLPREPAGNPTHLGSEPVTRALLEARGLSPDELSAEGMLRELFPGLAADYDTWVARTESGAAATDATRGNCMATLARVAGWLIRAGDIEVLAPDLDDPTRTETRRLRSMLDSMHLDDLFAINVELTDGVGLGRAAARRGKKPSAVRRALFVHLVELEAPAALERSKVLAATSGHSLIGAGGLPYVTDGIKADCERIWTMLQPVWEEDLMRGDAADVARWGVIVGVWNHLAKQVKRKRGGRALPDAYRVLAKDKKLLIRTITLPQVQCVGLHLRRIEIRALRQRWMTARDKAMAAGYDNPDTHRVVDDAAKNYFDALLAHTVLSILLDDGLRKKQYVFGRPGEHFVFELDRDATGRAIGIRSLVTNWSADTSRGANKRPRDAAHIKNWEGHADGRRGRSIRRGLVDYELLWDLISEWRPRMLVQCGVLSSVRDYDLEADLRRSPWVLFPTNDAPTDAQPGRNDRSRTDIGEKVGQELYYITRLLRPELPTWDVMRSDPAWRSLWAPHISRLLIASYWGGVRGHWDVAMYLTLDTQKTLEGEYSVVRTEMQELVGRNVTHWEHPHAYDGWMDRLYFDQEVFDPLDDPHLPLPTHLIGQVAKLRAQSAADRRRVEKSLRIRRPRPGQRGPIVAGASDERVAKMG